jgi:hypothetical protein
MAGRGDVAALFRAAIVNMAGVRVDHQTFVSARVHAARGGGLGRPKQPMPLAALLRRGCPHPDSIAGTVGAYFIHRGRASLRDPLPLVCPPGCRYRGFPSGGLCMLLQTAWGYGIAKAIGVALELASASNSVPCSRSNPRNVSVPCKGSTPWPVSVPLDRVIQILERARTR